MRHYQGHFLFVLKLKDFCNICVHFQWKKKKKLVDTIWIMSVLRMRGLHDKRHLLAKLCICGSENDILDVTFSRNLYFTDQGSPSVVMVNRKKRQLSPVDSDPYPKIAVTDLDGQQEQTLTKENVETPTAIVVNPRTG